MALPEYKCRFFALIALFFFTWMFVAPLAVVAATVTVPLGTPVSLTLNETVSPETHVPGQRLMLTVEWDVSVDKHVVIEAGSRAVGEVSVARKSGAVGAPAEIGVIVRTVTAVDGTVIPIQGSKIIQGESKQAESLVITILCCVLGLLMKGEKATIIEGSSIDARVDAPTAVEVDGE